MIVKEQFSECPSTIAGGFREQNLHPLCKGRSRGGWEHWILSPRRPQRAESDKAKAKNGTSFPEGILVAPTGWACRMIGRWRVEEHLGDALQEEGASTPSPCFVAGPVPSTLAVLHC